MKVFETFRTKKNKKVNPIRYKFVHPGLPFNLDNHYEYNKNKLQAYKTTVICGKETPHMKLI